MLTGWCLKLPLERSMFRQVSSERQKWIVLCREAEVQSMERSKGVDPERGSWIVRGVGYVVTRDQFILQKRPTPAPAHLLDMSLTGTRISTLG